MVKIDNTSLNFFFENSKREIHIPNKRLELLHEIADKITLELKERSILNINFIDTNNSRRSQLAQVWSFYAIEYFNIKNIFTFSGGTEVSAFHRNTVRTLQKAGFNFNIIDFSHQNPKYLITFKNSKKNILGYSKKFDNQENKYPYIAITTCTEANETCSYLPDALDRFHLPYSNPKTKDHTPLQDEKYLETNKVIAAEMFLLFEIINNYLQ